MLSRSNSIFHLGEDATSAASIDQLSSAPSSSLVGLRILIHLPAAGSRSTSNVVIKPVVKLPGSSVSVVPEFLKACYLCSKMLDSNKDTYMYRGDRGFCSVDCRNRQILLDERREIEASTKKRFGIPRRSHPVDVKPGRESVDRRRRVLVTVL